MQASVVICTYNRADLLRESIKAVQQQDFPSGAYEIIVVDNNSTDDTRAATESLAASSPVTIRYVFEENQGLSFARNAGIRNAQGEIVAFVDDDIDAEATWLAAIVKAFDDDAVACAGGPIRPVWPGKKPEWLSDDWVPYLTINEFEAARKAGAYTWPDTPWGANISFRKSVFDKVGLFPTDLGRIGTSLLSNEEVNICKKIAEAGLKIAFAPEAVIHHKIAPERITKQWFYHRTYWQGRSDAILDGGSGASIYAGIAERIRRYASAARNGESGSFYARCARRVALGYLYQATLAVKPSFRALIGYLCAQADSPAAEQLPTAATREFPGTQSLSGRGILVVDYEVPQFDKYAGSRTTFMYLKLLAGLGMQVYFMPDDFEKRDPYGDALEKLGIKVLHGEWFRNNWRQWIRNNADKLHYVLFNRPNITVNYIDFVKANTRSVILFQGHDLHYLRLSRKYEVDGDIEALKEADEYRKIEFDIIGKSDVILTFSDYERQVLSGHFPSKPIYSVPLFFYDQFPGRGADFRERKDIMFVGGCGHKPNLDAILWFANDVFPKVLEKVPDMVFHVIGTYPPQEVRDLASDWIKVVGHVSEEELEEYYRSIKTVVIPLRFGAGVKGKTIEALYRGVPLVSTAIGLEGIPGIGTAVRPADTAEDFAAELIALYQDDGRLEVTSALYREYAKSYLDAGNARNILAETLLRVAAPELAPEPKVEVPRTIHLPGQKSPRLIAFYLPQYHPIPENDEWWGKGFTEWRNVAKGKPLFPGHYQPHIPADLGFYDLRLDETRIAQAELAREYGIGGFCYYHYWFNGKRLLEKPVESMLASGKPDFPFCVCWANENWTRTWDGEERNVLMQQEYSEEDDRRHIRSLFSTFEDSRYIRIDGKPLFLVYRTENLPDPNRTAEVWREEARKAGIGELYLARVEGLGQIDPRSMGFDAGIEFAPDWKRKGPRLKADDLDINKWLLKHGTMAQVCEKNYVHRYESLADNMRTKQAPDFPWLRCVTPSWDNSARRTEGANIFVGSTPEKYQQWLTDAIGQAVPIGKDQEKVVFINAWNEWAEGNHLEPDQMHGRAYLEATRNAVISASLGNGFIRQDVDAEALRQLKQRVSAQEWQIIELDRMLVAKEQALSERERMLAEREQRIQDLLNSASWKATGLLRWGYEKILALKGS